VRYFFVTFHVPRDVAAGKYAGEFEVLLGQESPYRTIPVSLRAQELAQPELKDVYVGLIYNGGLPDVDDMLVQYSRSGFNCITWFHRWLPFRQDEDGTWHIDVEGFDKKMKQLIGLGITAGVCLYTDVQLDDKPKGHRGVMFAHADGQKDEYVRMMRELEAAVAAHPEWPRIIYMNWDEPPPFNERMGWTNEVAPDAITTLDVQFARLPRIMRFYNTPNFDDPANWAGPELYDWVRRQGKDFGLCGATDTAEANRYQAGMFMITSGAKYFHAWHIRGGHTPGQMAYDDGKKQTIRGHEMIAWAGGMDDLKAYHLLQEAIDEATGSGRNAEAVRAAKDYLASVLAVFNGDHRDRWSLQPYLGAAWSWGYEGFYDDWQEKMARHAAAIKGVPWVD
jgi:hypothetical protein